MFYTLILPIYVHTPGTKSLLYMTGKRINTAKRIQSTSKHDKENTSPIRSGTLPMIT